MSTPKILILIRFLLSPIILLLSYFLGITASFIVVILMYFGLLTDIFDGIIARKQNSSTESLRRLDSQVDMIFWVSIGVSAWLLYPTVIEQQKYYVLMVIVMEAMCYIISLIKFKKETCTHAFLSKIWGLTLLAAFTSIIGFGTAGFLFYIAIFMAMISHLDVILIILLLPKWQHDIPSSYHAYLIRVGKTFKKNKFLNS